MQPIQHLTLEIIDYPGEWLLDLPLLEQSFAQFSRDALALAEQPVRRAGRGRAGSSGCAAFDPDGAGGRGRHRGAGRRFPPLPARIATTSWA